MIAALDIETVANLEAVARMPEPEVKTGNIKDPAKIAEKMAEAKREQVEKAALDPLTARIVCVAVVNDEKRVVQTVDANDEAERVLIQNTMGVIGGEAFRAVSWNGVGFDLPMIYKRALLLGIDPGNFGAPPLMAWTKKYSPDRHFDLMQIWTGWNGYAKLDTVARMVLGQCKAEMDVTLIAALLETEEGKKKVGDYCLQDTVLTWELFKRFNGTLFT